MQTSLGATNIGTSGSAQTITFDAPSYATLINATFQASTYNAATNLKYGLVDGTGNGVLRTAANQQEGILERTVFCNSDQTGYIWESSSTSNTFLVHTNGHYLPKEIYNGAFASPTVTAPTTYTAKMYRAAAQSIPNATATKIDFDTEDFDSGSLADTSTDKFTVPVDGYYLISGYVRFSDSNIGSGEQLQFYYQINASGTAKCLYQFPAGPQYATATINQMEYLEAGDYLEFYLFHGFGTSVDTETNGYDQLRASVSKLN
jgi:hypothetical protein